jgi:hypothetical protein
MGSRSVIAWDFSQGWWWFMCLWAEYRDRAWADVADTWDALDGSARTGGFDLAGCGRRSDCFLAAPLMSSDNELKTLKRYRESTINVVNR